MTRHRQRVALPMLMLIGACSGGQTDQIETQVEEGQEFEILASVDLEGGSQLEILTSETDDGTILTYREKGPYGSKSIGSIEGQNGNPVEFLRKMGKPVPRRLIEFAAQFDFDDGEKSFKDLSSPTDEEPPVILAFKEGEHYARSHNWVGANGETCPFTVFASRDGQWGPSCPSSGGDFRWCAADKSWGIVDASTLWTFSAYNTMCVDYVPVSSPVIPVFSTVITRSDTGQPEASWIHWVPQGWWIQEYTRILKKCYWFGCSVPVAGIKYDMQDGGFGSRFHFGGRWWRQ